MKTLLSFLKIINLLKCFKSFKIFPIKWQHEGEIVLTGTGCSEVTGGESGIFFIQDPWVGARGIKASSGLDLFTGSISLGTCERWKEVLRPGFQEKQPHGLQIENEVETRVSTRMTDSFTQKALG